MKTSIQSTVKNLFGKFTKKGGMAGSKNAGPGFTGHRHCATYGKANRDWQIMVWIFAGIVVVIVFFSLSFFNEINSGDVFAVTGSASVASQNSASTSTSAFNRASLDALIGTFSARASQHSVELSGTGDIADPSL